MFEGVLIDWYEAKLAIEHSVDFSSDSLHVIVGFALFLAAALILTRQISSVLPWGIVLVSLVWRYVLSDLVGGAVKG